VIKQRLHGIRPAMFLYSTMGKSSHTDRLLDLRESGPRSSTTSLDELGRRSRYSQTARSVHPFFQLFAQRSLVTDRHTH